MNFYLKDLVRYRELFYFFAWRDILVRYRQATLGIGWAVIRPLLQMAVFALLFGRIAHLPSDDVPYSFFVLAAMLPWQLFANASLDTCNSLVNNSHLISKVYFPRMIVPSAEIVVHLVDFSITFIILFFLLLVTGHTLSWTMCALPFLMALIILLCLGTGLWLSALTVQYRDFRIIVPFALQFGLFISPVGYGSFLVPEQWQALYLLNPLVGIIDGFRWAFFGITHSYFEIGITYSIVFTLLWLISGVYYFRKMEKTFADRI